MEPARFLALIRPEALTLRKQVALILKGENSYLHRETAKRTSFPFLLVCSLNAYFYYFYPDKDLGFLHMLLVTVGGGSRESGRREG